LFRLRGVARHRPRRQSRGSSRATCARGFFNGSVHLSRSPLPSLSQQALAAGKVLANVNASPPRAASTFKETHVQRSATLLFACGFALAASASALAADASTAASDASASTPGTSSTSTSSTSPDSAPNATAQGAAAPGTGSSTGTSGSTPGTGSTSSTGANASGTGSATASSTAGDADSPAKKIFDQLDANKDGTLTFDEFSRAQFQQR
jgi:hypothetical protein